jgi:hypothetical protein
MVIYVDIDGTICTSPNANYQNATPRKEQIKKINTLYNEGHTIIYHSARGTATKINWTDLTLSQLKKWDCLYHKLELGKPQYDIWIDDKSKRIEEI